MQNFQITISVEEAAIITAALDFVRRNLAIDADTMLWRFVSGDKIAFDVSQVFALEQLETHIADTAADALEQHPFNPYIKTF